MSAIGALLPEEDILLDVEPAGRNALFQAVGRLFERRHGLSAGKVAASLDAREGMGSTGLGQGVAIPHARIKGLDRALAAFVRTGMPIDFGAPDGKPVSEFFVLLVPAQATELHLQILAEVAARFGDRAFRAQLRACTTPAEAQLLFAGRAPA